MKVFGYLLLILALTLNQCNSNVFATTVGTTTITTATTATTKALKKNDNGIVNQDENVIMVHLKPKYIDRKLRKGRTRVTVKPPARGRRHRNVRLS